MHDPDSDTQSRNRNREEKRVTVVDSGYFSRNKGPVSIERIIPGNGRAKGKDGTDPWIQQEEIHQNQQDGNIDQQA
jgi:hypothetical protein